MSFQDVLFGMTGFAGWIIIAMVVIALGFVVGGYIRQAVRIVRSDGWSALWQQIRIHVLTRKPRNRG